MTRPNPTPHPAANPAPIAQRTDDGAGVHRAIAIDPAVTTRSECPVHVTRLADTPGTTLTTVAGHTARSGRPATEDRS